MPVIGGDQLIQSKKGVMARLSKTGQVTKVCGCAKWKDCAHPWYVSYHEGTETGSGGKVRERGLRCQSLGVALFSVDRFKRINEQYGQAVGDQVLAEVKHAIATSQPAGDIAIRWDADGFLVMLPNANEKQACAFAERVKSALVLVQLPDGLVVSVTVGSAEMTAGESIQDTIGRADELLYRRRAASRNPEG